MQAHGAPGARKGIGDFDALLADVKAGRPSGWDRCYRWLAPAVGGYLRMQGAREVDDLTSEVFLAIFRNIGTFSGTEANFRSWVFVIAHRRLQDERRRRFRRPTPDSLDESSLERIGRMASRPGSAGTESAGADDEALRAIGTARVSEMCARLAPDQREVVLLRILGDLTVDQVAEVLGKSPGAVKQLQRRGFEALRRLVDREGVPL
jgi:RNA polymerase sigma-70 factor (ECF subfamily)